MTGDVQAAALFVAAAALAVMTAITGNIAAAFAAVVVVAIGFSRSAQ